jgi:hypothetical protein
MKVCEAVHDWRDFPPRLRKSSRHAYLIVMSNREIATDIIGRAAM